MTGSPSCSLPNALAELAASDPRGPTGSAARDSFRNLSDSPVLLEVGIGRRPDVARALAGTGYRVIAIDVVDRPVPDEVAFARLDVHDLAMSASPRRSLPIPEADADAAPVALVYGRNLPAEIQPATVRLAERLDAAAAFTTLGFEDPSPSLRVERRTVGSDTLYVVSESRGQS
ncbi:UPF0146 family protein [Halopenitus salinus]|uniref:UPF0146 family protein n=1 Tax=Halopenitus salinus TaxID=1198295 RepID=A0ABD5US41_9EURY